MYLKYPINNIGISGRLIIMTNQQMCKCKIYNNEDWTNGLYSSPNTININFFTGNSPRSLIASAKSLKEVEEFAKMYNNNKYFALTIEHIDHFFNVDLSEIFSTEELNSFFFKIITCLT